MIENILNYQVCGGLRVLHLLFVAPILYIIIYEMNSIYKKSHSLRAKSVATIYQIVGKPRDKRWLLMFTTGGTAFIDNPVPIKDLIDLAGVGKAEELIGVTIRYHSNKHNIIEGKSMEVL